MLVIIDSINESVLADNHVLVIFNVVSIFPNTDNMSGLKVLRIFCLITILMLIPHNV